MILILVRLLPHGSVTIIVVWRKRRRVMIERDRGFAPPVLLLVLDCVNTFLY